MSETAYAVQVSVQDSPLWRNGRKPLLNALDIELTERCNNDCLHCYINRPAGDAEARAREMDTAEVKRILDQAAALGCLRVRFTGGEPLLRPDFEELYLHARRLGMKVRLFTNGRLITPRLADLFARIPPRMPIDITVYGMTQASYETMSRAAGSFAQFRSGVDLLLEHGVPFTVKAALLGANRDEMAAFEAWAATIPWMEQRPGYSMYFDLRARRDNEAKNQLIKSLRADPETGIAVFSRNRAAYLKDMRQFCSQFMGRPADKLFACSFGRGGCVDAYGRFQPCMGIRAAELTYDLRAPVLPAPAARATSEAPERPSLRDALERVFPPLRELRATNPEYLRRCGRCFLKGLCEQCPAKSWAEYGTLDTPVEYLCGVAHATARDLGLLTEGEQAWQIENWRDRIARFVGADRDSTGTTRD